MPRDPYTQTLEALDALYAALPTILCKKQCQASCGVIVMTRVEWLRLQRYMGYRPKDKCTLVCPLLRRGCCSVYPVRPLICRLWGVSELMPCPWGCIPERWVTDAEGTAWIRRVEELSAALFPGRAVAGAPLQQEVLETLQDATLPQRRSTDV